MSSDLPSTPPTSVFQMKEFLTKHRVSFADCVEKSDLQKRVNDTLEKLQQQHKQKQMHTCDCAQTSGPHSHDIDPAASSSSSSSASSQAAKKAKNPNPAIVKTIAVGMLACNMTIIADSVTKEALLIDPGGDPDKIIALVNEMGVTIKQILVTHAHFDHFLAAEEVRTHTKAPVLLHQADTMFWKSLPLQCMMIGQPAPKTTVRDPDSYFVDGQELAVRNGKVIHTPGHTPGSCCFYFATDDLLCSGDTLFRQSVGRTDLPGGNSQELMKSIQTKLYTLPPETQVIPGHGPSTDILFESKYNGVVRAAKSASL